MFDAPMKQPRGTARVQGRIPLIASPAGPVTLSGSLQLGQLRLAQPAYLGDSGVALPLVEGLAGVALPVDGVVVEGAGDMVEGAVVDGAEDEGAVVEGVALPAAGAASSFLLQAVSDTARMDARIKVLPIMDCSPFSKSANSFPWPRAGAYGKTLSQAKGKGPKIE